jgi:hypothetical protein
VAQAGRFAQEAALQLAERAAELAAAEGNRSAALVEAQAAAVQRAPVLCCCSGFQAENEGHFQEEQALFGLRMGGRLGRWRWRACNCSYTCAFCEY